jgi:hypothetical protein
VRTTLARPLVVASALTSCRVFTPCVEERLELWCFHSELDSGPVGWEELDDPACEPPELTEGTACGRYEVDAAPGSFTSVTHYFLEGRHVATRYTTDVNTYCGGFDFWYGQKIDCTLGEP